MAPKSKLNQSITLNTFTPLKSDLSADHEQRITMKLDLCQFVKSVLYKDKNTRCGSVDCRLDTPRRLRNVFNCV